MPHTSSALRRRLRRWGVQGIGTALAWGAMAARRVKNAGAEITAMADQLGRRIAEAASELREQWEDFLAEAGPINRHTRRSLDNGEWHAETCGKKRGKGVPGLRPSGSKTRSRRLAGKTPT